MIVELNNNIDNMKYTVKGCLFFKYQPVKRTGKYKVQFLSFLLNHKQEKYIMGCKTIPSFYVFC